MTEKVNREFPRLFLPEAYHDRSAAVPQEIITKARCLLEAALASLFRRMTLPWADDGVNFAERRVFSLLEDRLRAESLPGAGIFIVGGMLRSALGYLYERLWRASRQGQDTAAVLEGIIGETADVPEHILRGTGSDCDLVVRASDPEAQNRAKLLVYRAIVSVAQKGRLHADGSPLRLLVMPPLDLRNDPPELHEWTRIGGAATDYLEFDFAAGRLLEAPPLEEGVVKNLLLGEYSDITWFTGKHQARPLTPAVRALRPLVEIPFLNLSEASSWHQRLEKLRDLLAKRSCEAEDLRLAVRQLEKMVVNARLSAGNNRIFQARPGSLEHAVKWFLDVLADTAGVPRFPEFVPTCPERHLSSAVTERSALESTPLYYAAPHVRGALSLLRRGLMSPCRMTTERRLAETWAGNEGAVILLAFKPGVESSGDIRVCGSVVTILNAEAVLFPDNPWQMANLLAVNSAEGRAASLDAISVYRWVQCVKSQFGEKWVGQLDACHITLLKDAAREALRRSPEVMADYPWNGLEDEEDASFLLELLEAHPGFTWDMGDMFFSRLIRTTEPGQMGISFTHHDRPWPLSRLRKIGISYFYALWRAMADNSFSQAPDQERVLSQALKLKRALFAGGDVPFSQALVADEFARAVLHYYDETPYFRGTTLRPWQDPQLLCCRQELAAQVRLHAF